MEKAQRPWPEALAGAILGVLSSLFIAFLPAVSRFIEDPATAPLVVLTGALVGALASWRIAGRSMRKIVRAEEIVERSRRGAHPERRAA